jgi:hypothetical protein
MVPIIIKIDDVKLLPSINNYSSRTNEAIIDYIKRY